MADSEENLQGEAKRTDLEAKLTSFEKEVTSFTNNISKIPEFCHDFRDFNANSLRNS